MKMYASRLPCFAWHAAQARGSTKRKHPVSRGRFTAQKLHNLSPWPTSGAVHCSLPCITRHVGSAIWKCGAPKMVSPQLEWHNLQLLQRPGNQKAFGKAGDKSLCLQHTGHAAERVSAEHETAFPHPRVPPLPPSAWLRKQCATKCNY